MSIPPDVYLPSVRAQTPMPPPKTKPRLLVVKVHADWCPACRNIAEAWAKTSKRHARDAEFVVLDVTTRQSAAQAAMQARALGIESWFRNYRGRTSTVGILNREDGSVYSMFVNEADPAAYSRAIRAAKKQAP